MKTLLVGVIGLCPVLGGAELKRGAAPHESVIATVQAFRQNDMLGLVESMLTDEQMSFARQEWDAWRRTRPDREEDEAFRQSMEQLTARGAEERIMADLQPQLDEMRPQVAMMVGMFTGMAQAAIAQNDTMSAEDRAAAGRMLGAIGNTLMKNDITDVATAKKAVGIVCGAARKLRLHSLSDVQALEFDDLLKRGDVVLAATKDVLALYGLSVDSWLSTFRAETLRKSGDEATVRVHYEILGVRESADYAMVRVDGRWVRKEAADLPIGF